MRVQIRDGDALALLALADVRAYLEAHGWQARAPYGSVATITVKESNGREHQFLLPARKELGDDPARMGDIVETLSKLEGRSHLLVHEDLTGSNRDKDLTAIAARYAQ